MKSFQATYVLNNFFFVSVKICHSQILIKRMPKIKAIKYLTSKKLSHFKVKRFQNSRAKKGLLQFSGL